MFAALPAQHFVGTSRMNERRFRLKFLRRGAAFPLMSWTRSTESNLASWSYRWHAAVFVFLASSGGSSYRWGVSSIRAWQEMDGWVHGCGNI